MITVTRRLEWDAAHRVLRHESKCATLHGHRYVALITCTGQLDDCSRVIDFGVVRSIVGKWIDDNWDHTTLVNRDDHDLLAFTTADYMKRDKRQPYVFEGEPTAENIATTLLAIARALLADSKVHVSAVEVFETPNCSARVAD